MTEELKNRIETTMQNLRRNKMEAYFCENSAEACELVKSLIKEGDVISCGGSVTLKQTGVYDLITSSDYNFLDRSREGITREEVEEVYRKTFSADVFCTSTNALTENGELYNVDGNSNRVAAILYGPKSVIVVCGVNKLVKNIGEASPTARSRDIAFRSTRKTPSFARAVTATAESAATTSSAHSSGISTASR